MIIQRFTVVLPSTRTYGTGIRFQGTMAVRQGTLAQCRCRPCGKQEPSTQITTVQTDNRAGQAAGRTTKPDGVSGPPPKSNGGPTRYKRDALFLGLSAVFLTALVMGNIIGTTKFIQLFSIDLPDRLLPLVPDMVRDGGRYSMIIPVGLLAFPFTFFVTDLISELFGRKKAQLLVFIGFGMNLFMLAVMTANFYLPDASGVSGGTTLFDGVYGFMVGNTIGSMIAYLVAQTVDVQLFHFWKRFTKGRHLWLRNNASTMVSQLVDSTAILSILYFAGNLGDNVTGMGALLILIINSYMFKFFSALLDTPICYAAVHYFRDYYEDPEGYQLPERHPAPKKHGSRVV